MYLYVNRKLHLLALYLKKCYYLVNKEIEMTTKDQNITFRIHPSLKKVIEAIAAEERRTVSSQLRIALEEWLKMKEELHPNFLQDIEDARTSGKPVPVWKG